jgi:uncharacterized membrane protein
VALKALDGALEVGGGILLAIVGGSGLTRMVTFLTQHELSEDPQDLVAGWLVRTVTEMGASTLHFAIAYLVVHGLVKLALAAGLLRERLAVFPVALAFLGLFIAYQGYRLAVGPSWELGFLTVVDVLIALLVWAEFRSLRRG